MPRVFTLMSGSSGNSCFVGDSRGGILVDAGGSCRAIRQALAVHGVELRQLRGIFITHEHSDHIAALRVLTKNLPLPIYGTPGTIAALQRMAAVSPGAPLIPLYEPAEISGMRVTAFDTPHDSAASCGFRIEMEDESCIGIATDMGHVTPEVEAGLRGCDMALVEANYDLAMLRSGHYPYHLRRRIEGENGHLCNTDCAAFLPRLVEQGTRRICLAHLSKDNNRPDIALATCRGALDSMGMESGVDYLLSAAPRSEAGELMIF